MNKNATKKTEPQQRPAINSPSDGCATYSQMLRSLSDCGELVRARVVRCLPVQDATRLSAKLLFRRSRFELLATVPAVLNQRGILSLSVREPAPQRTKFPQIRIWLKRLATVLALTTSQDYLQNSLITVFLVNSGHSSIQIFGLV